jgi:acyl-CoA synthetase (AMP-forming)/AMP-acid ligase II
VLVDDEGRARRQRGLRQPLPAHSWPGQARTIYGDHERFHETYFTRFPGLYFTGDGCRRDEDGYYWITGRVDDVINVSGHRLGTAEVESALVAHEAVAEAAVVGFPHEIKGRASSPTSPRPPRPRTLDPRRAGRRAQGAGAPRHRPDRHAGRDPDRPGAAQDALGQDHAPHPAADRRRRVRGPRRRHDPRRPRWIFVAGLYCWIASWRLFGLHWGSAWPIFLLAAGLSMVFGGFARRAAVTAKVSDAS